MIDYAHRPTRGNVYGRPGMRKVGEMTNAALREKLNPWPAAQCFRSTYSLVHPQIAHQEITVQKERHNVFIAEFYQLRIIIDYVAQKVDQPSLAIGQILSATGSFDNILIGRHVFLHFFFLFAILNIFGR